MMKMNLTDNQNAFDYALYMITSSYYADCTCKSTILENKLCVQYHEQKTENQYYMEEQCINDIEKELMGTIPDDGWEESAEAHTVRREGDEAASIRFLGKTYALYIKGVYKGKTRPEFSYTIGKR
ncbi:MAG: hypothetical protein MJ119_01155 [Lachnospiraceae bacterium]|nr:hypothetical protein [Lachnospiraceae bacterium]